MFFQVISQKNFDFSRQIIYTEFRFFGQFHKKLRFSRQKLAIYSNFWANYSISIQSHHFGTYFLYMIRYNNILRPVHDPHGSLCNPCDPPTTSLPKIWGVATPKPPRIDAYAAVYTLTRNNTRE